jgi:hypothetical protein
MPRQSPLGLRIRMARVSEQCSPLCVYTCHALYMYAHVGVSIAGACVYATLCKLDFLCTQYY